MDKKKLVCSECSKEFKSQGGLDWHVSHAHSNNGGGPVKSDLSTWINRETQPAHDSETGVELAVISQADWDNAVEWLKRLIEKVFPADGAVAAAVKVESPSPKKPGEGPPFTTPSDKYSTIIGLRDSLLTKNLQRIHPGKNILQELEKCAVHWRDNGKPLAIYPSAAFCEWVEGKVGGESS